MIFISTTKFWDELTYNDEDRGRFTFLWNGKRLKQTLHLNTRFMKNIYALLHENDYFALSQLPSKIVKFLIIDSNKKRKIQDIEYFFNYGELYGKVDF
jgi:hypothetical protein